MDRKYLYLLILMFLVSPAFSQAKEGKTVSLFAFQNAQFEYERYKWGDELYLTIKGKAHPILDGGVLLLSIWYYGERVRYTNVFLKYDPAKEKEYILFSLRWGPLNDAFENVLSGEYPIELAFHLDHQVPKLRSYLQQALAGKEVKSQKRKLFFGTPSSFEEEESKIKQFYAQRMKVSHGLYTELVRRGMPASSSKEYVDLRSWREWLDRFLQQLETENKIASRFHKTQFCRRYSVAKGSLVEYYDMLLRFSKLMSISIYKRQNAQPDQKDTNLDTFGIKRLDIIQLNLKRLMGQIAGDLKLDVADILK